MDENGDTLLADLPERCPFGLDDLTTDRFDAENCVERIRAAARSPE